MTDKRRMGSAGPAGLSSRQWLVAWLAMSILTVTGCASGEVPTPSLAGQRVTIVGPEQEHELRSIQEAFAPFEQRTGITVAVTGSPTFEESIGEQIDQGSPPDIALFPQPGLLRDLADEIVPPAPELVAAVGDSLVAWNDHRLDLVTVEGQVLAVPVSADLKSLVWYSPDAFEAAGYELPRTLAEFEDLARRMVDDGRTPFCLGLADGVATGWPLTDWFEDYLLRLEGPALYDAWHEHRIPFGHPDVVAVAQHVVDLLSQEGFVFGGLERAASRSFSEAGLPVLDGRCMMYRMAHFHARYWPIGTEIGRDGDVDAFYLPGTPEHPRPALTGGTYATAFSDRRAVRRTLEYMAGARYASERAENQDGGFLSTHRDVPTHRYAIEVDRRAVEFLNDEANVVRYDASDLMPGGVGSDLFWDVVVEITRGELTVEEGFAQIEQSWPPG